jgi:hypothetical protein
MARYQSKRKGKYKSRLESLFAELCFKHGLGFKYEADKIPYIRPAHYVPDWKIAENVYIETKGYLAPSDRSKLVAFKEQHPKITILLVFGNSDNRLNSKSKTTYGQWATKHDFQWADIRNGLPVQWWEKHTGNTIDNQTHRKRRRR